MNQQSLLFDEIQKKLLFSSYRNNGFIGTEYYTEKKSQISSGRFVYQRELELVNNIIRNEDECTIVINGAAGSGKTFFLRTLIELLHNSEEMRSAFIISGYDLISNSIFENTTLSFEKIIEDFNIKSTHLPILIDDIEEVTSCDEFLHYLKKAGYKKIILTSRNIYQPVDIQNNHVITLLPLNREQSYALIRDFLYHNYYGNTINSDYINSLVSTLNITSISTPREIIRLLLQITKSSNCSEQSLANFLKDNRHFLYQYGKGVDVSSMLILPDKTIITPPQDVIAGIQIIDKQLLQHIKNDPSLIDRLSPREFEEMVCDLLNVQGYDVELTQQTRDGGKDIIITQHSLAGDFCIYVECKKYDKTRPVRVKLVRELYGTVMADNVTAGLMVTTSYYTKAAKEFRETVKSRIKLKDYEDLVCEIAQLP